MTDTNLNIAASRGHVQALAFARKGGAALSNILAGIAKAKEADRRGPLEMMLFIDETYSDDEKHSVPVPGSKKGETGNLPYDRYTADRDTADGKRKVPASWYTDAIRDTAEAARVQHLIDCCDDATTDECPDYIKDMGTGERKAEKKRLKQWLADMRTGLTKGAMLFLHAEEISEINPERIRVRMPFKQVRLLGTDGQPYKLEGTNEYASKMIVTGNIIRLQDPTGEKEDLSFTVSEFLSLNPDKLTGAKDTWTINALEQTKARGAKGKGSKGKAKDLAIPTTVEQLLGAFNIIHSALDQKTEQGEKLLSKLLAGLSAPGQEGDDKIETVGDFLIELDDNVWTVINARYNAIKANKAKAANAKAAAELKAAASQ